MHRTPIKEQPVQSNAPEYERLLSPTSIDGSTIPAYRAPTEPIHDPSSYGTPKVAMATTRARRESKSSKRPPDTKAGCSIETPMTIPTAQVPPHTALVPPSHLVGPDDPYDISDKQHYGGHPAKPNMECYVTEELDADTTELKLSKNHRQIIQSNLDQDLSYVQGKYHTDSANLHTYPVRLEANTRNIHPQYHQMTTPSTELGSTGFISHSGQPLTSTFTSTGQGHHPSIKHIGQGHPSMTPIGLDKHLTSTFTSGHPGISQISQGHPSMTHVGPGQRHMGSEYQSLQGPSLSHTSPTGTRGSSSQTVTSSVDANLESWQYGHRKQLLRQQIDATHGGMSQLPQFTSLAHVMPPIGDDEHRWGALRRAADNILKEKDMVIERQKIKILQLEQQSRDSESQLHKALVTNINSTGDGLKMKNQELEYENACLQSKLKESISERDTEIKSLQAKLGQAEYDLDELRTLTEKQTDEQSNELLQLRDQIEDRETELSDWRGKHNKLNGKYNAVKKKLDSLERYLADLPTAEEHNQSLQKISFEEESSLKDSQISDLEQKLLSRERLICDQKIKIEDLEDQYRDLSVKTERLGKDNNKLKKERAEADGGATIRLEEELEELRWDNDRMKSELLRARKVLETKHKVHKDAEMKNKAIVSELEERINHEEASVLAMREDSQVKEKQMKLLQKTMKEVSNQNQDLMERNMMLQDLIQQLEMQTGEEKQKMEQRLQLELDACFLELKSLVNICLQQAEGKDPNLSALLGVQSSSQSVTMNKEPKDTAETLKQKIHSVKMLRKDIDSMRAHISNKYAELMGEALSCTTQ
ncbi:unnamed protein product [Owenia fusiformis]|uniref:Centrosomal protein of 85 kDa-like CC4 coiled-coil domain-containing protein n=1 Tax=Owenia fusiformis TaxID=6347 RepID=A0A8J1TAW5_OWEFU|nr:unnamed protein product [Owenia fusiformis]